MINLLCTFRRDDHPIRLNQEFHRALTWWRELFQSWDGLSFFLMPAWAPLPDFQVSSDAAGSLGFGAIFNSQWFYGGWAVSQQPRSMAYKEVFPIVVAAHLWGSQWSTRRVEFLCDNESVVAVLSSGISREADLMVLLRYLALLAVCHSCSFKASSVRGKANLVADSPLPFPASALSPPGPTRRGNSDANSSSSPCSAASDLTARCLFFLSQGLAPSTRRVYLSAQRRYAQFCHQEGRLDPGGAMVPADEQSLMRFAALLADNLHHLSIKVYLSAVRSLHIDNGLPDPLVNCLQLQRLLQGIKRVQGSSPPSRLPITVDLLQ